MDDFASLDTQGNTAVHWGRLNSGVAQELAKSVTVYILLKSWMDENGRFLNIKLPINVGKTSNPVRILLMTLPTKKSYEVFLLSEQNSIFA